MSFQGFNFRVAKFFATYYYVGLIPKAPGTWGTLAAVILIYPFLSSLSIYQMQGILYFTFFAGTWVTDVYCTYTGRDDPKEVVIDEVLGIWFCMFFNMYFVPQVSLWVMACASFVLFRFFDILKPFPASYFDKMKNALGVMLDDVMAALMASAVYIIATKIYFKYFTV